MLYRLYRPGDFANLYAIELACFQPPFRFSRGTMHQLLESPASASPASASWIAEEGGQMHGFAIAHWTRESQQTVAYIQTIEVDPTQRNRGIARELLRRVETSAIAAGAQAIWLHVAEENTAAIGLYESHGYLATGREENYYAKGIAALIYSKPLDPASGA